MSRKREQERQKRIQKISAFLATLPCEIEFRVEMPCKANKAYDRHIRHAKKYQRMIKNRKGKK